jgi:hypothetical protein
MIQWFLKKMNKNEFHSLGGNATKKKIYNNVIDLWFFHLLLCFRFCPIRIKPTL